MDGATNWMSTAFDPARRLFYLMALEKCNIFSKSAAVWKAGESFYGGGARDVPGETPANICALSIWKPARSPGKFAQTGDEESWGGVLATASGLLFYCDDVRRLRRGGCRHWRARFGTCSSTPAGKPLP